MIPRILDTLFLSVPHLAGDDVRQRSEERRRYCFYLRHPRGWRQPSTPILSSGNSVSIHATPAGGDLWPPHSIRQRHLCFYPRHPRGWRQPHGQPKRDADAFLSTPPSRVATHLWDTGVHLVQVSIHATLAGGDNAALARSCCAAHVSIHATLAGGDSWF